MTGDELREALIRIVREGQPIGIPSDETVDEILRLLAGKRLVVSLEDDGDAIPNRTQKLERLADLSTSGEGIDHDVLESGEGWSHATRNRGAK